jgi:uncharacterized protein YcaQ
MTDLTERVARALFVTQGDFADPVVADRMWRNVAERTPRSLWHQEAATVLAEVAAALRDDGARVLAGHDDLLFDREADTWRCMDCRAVAPGAVMDDAILNHQADVLAAWVEGEA